MKTINEVSPGEYEAMETKIKYLGKIELLDTIGNFFERTDIHEDGTLTKYYGIEIDDEDVFYSIVKENHEHTFEPIGAGGHEAKYIYACECGYQVGLHFLLKENEELKEDLKEIAKRIKTLEPFDIY